MGAQARRTPKRLPEKLREIRLKLGLSQNELIRQMGLEEELTREQVSSFELGRRQPNLATLLAYAQAANVYVDALISDSMDLPEALPCLVKSEGITRPSKSKKPVKELR
ncbi:MAG TPA: helix-turn-helix transcriptional regulator [Pyrinomonadaceae bacterium]|jgi:transcriptional regulator with XRE-family HTH domain